MKKKQELKKYRKPSLKAVEVELENGFAAASATITPGGPGGATNYNPEVEDWIDDPGQTGTMDM